MSRNLTPFLVSAAFLVSGLSARAGLIGQAVEVDYLYPTQGAILQVLGTGTVTGGGFTVNSFGQHNYTVFDSQIVLQNVAGTQISFLAATFNGYGLTETGGTPFTITNVTVDGATNVSGFVPSRVSFDATHVFLNMQGLLTQSGQEVVLDLNGFTGSVPEPTTFGLVFAALAAGIARHLHRR
jgi:hypothetical protein